MSLNEDFSALQHRFEELAEDEAVADGFALVAEGLKRLSAEETIKDGGLYEPTVRALRDLVERLENRQNANQFDTPPVPIGLEQFVATFRQDSEKRLRGLSISLMGVFGNAPNEEAIQKSAGHLHAIRGGAAMLQLEDVAEVARVMEAVIQSKEKLNPEERNWPTRTLLRAFAILHDAIQAEPVSVQAQDAPEVLERLRGVAGIAAKVTPEKSLSSPAPEKTADLGFTSATNATSREQPILIVDDSATIAASVGFIIAELEVPIEIASNGEEALRLLQERPFSLVISDVDMPRMDGITLTRQVRQNPALAELPLILLTSLDHPEEKQAGMEAGATDYLIKGSIGGGELVDKVRNLLRHAPSYEVVETAEAIRILVAEDTETVAASIAFVLSERPFEIILSSDGREALRKLEKGRYDLLITDMQMPYMGGIELVTQLRQKPRFSDLPVIMLTSVQDEELISQARAAGVDRYLIKGEIAGGKLLATVDELLTLP